MTVGPTIPPPTDAAVAARKKQGPPHGYDDLHIPPRITAAHAAASSDIEIIDLSTMTNQPTMIPQVIKPFSVKQRQQPGGGSSHPVSKVISLLDEEEEDTLPYSSVMTHQSKVKGKESNYDDDVVIVLDAAAGTAVSSAVASSAVSTPWMRMMKPMYKYDYSSTSSSFLFPITAQYTQHALSQLYYDFPWLHQRFLTMSLSTLFYGRYSYMYDTILTCFIPQQKKEYATATTSSFKTEEEQALQSMKQFLYPLEHKKKFCPTIHFTNNFQQKILSKILQSSKKTSWLLSIPRMSPPPTTNPTTTTTTATSSFTQEEEQSWSILQEEKHYVQNKWNTWKQHIQEDIHLHTLRQEAEIQGTTIECQCCFTHVAFEEMIACLQEGHLFCRDCIRRHVEERVFGLGSFIMQHDDDDSKIQGSIIQTKTTTENGQDNTRTSSTTCGGMDITCLYSGMFVV